MTEIVQPKYQIIAIISGILTIMAFSNLVLTVYIKKEAEHLSYTWIMLVLTAQSLLVIYGLINNSYGIFIPSSIIIMGASYILFVKLNNNNNMKIIEDELKTKNILIN